MRNTPLKAFIKSPIKHSLSLTEKEHKEEHDTNLGKKLKQSLKKIKDK
jgi:hypothetical protein|tara:strand:+ start:276 stop:419 length:144 start_codon:yes stop_codon:yes gene_type:complete